MMALIAVIHCSTVLVVLCERNLIGLPSALCLVAAIYQLDVVSFGTYLPAEDDSADHNVCPCTIQPSTNTVAFAGLYIPH